MKKKFIYIAAVAAYWSGLNTLFYWLNRKSKRILTFHNILPESFFEKSLPNGVSNSDVEFKKIINEVARKYKFSTDVKDVSSATITFDDGYLNQYEVASRILDEMGGVPAILFVSGKIMNNTTPNKALVIDQLMHWVAYAPNGEYKNFKLTTSNRAEIWNKVVRPLYTLNINNKGMGIYNELNSEYPFANLFSNLSRKYVELRLTGISDYQLEDLCRKGWKIGWHTWSHFPLALLPLKEKVVEISCPKDFYMDAPFSYPYGELISVDEESIGVVKKCGYTCALSNILDGDRFRGKYFISRMSLPSNKYRLHFRLSGLEYFIKNWKLLPK